MQNKNSVKHKKQTNILISKRVMIIFVLITFLCLPYATETKSVKRLSPNVRIYAYANKKRISLRKYGNAYLCRKMVKVALGALGGFDRLRVFTCRNTPDMVFNANAEKEKKNKVHAVK